LRDYVIETINIGDDIGDITITDLVDDLKDAEYRLTFK